MWIDDLLTLQSYFEYLIQPIIRLPKRLPFLPQIVLMETHTTGCASADGVSVLYLWFFEGVRGVLEQAAGLHLQVAVDDVDREVLGRGEQAVDAKLAQGVDDECLLVVDLGGNGMLVIFPDAVWLLVDEVSAFFINEKDD